MREGTALKFKYVRIYADEQGESHFEDVEADLTERPMSWVSENVPAIDVSFTYTDKGTEFFADRHPTGVRHVVIVLEGGVSVEASDGEVRWFGPESPHGPIVLLEDMEGKGHLNRGVNADPRYSVTIRLPDR